MPAPLPELTPARELSQCTCLAGQDPMRVVKQRLLEMLPGVRVFLDVDDLHRKVGKGAEELRRADKLLLFASDGFFGGEHAPSRPCMVELLQAIHLGLEIITVLEVEEKHRPLTKKQLHEQMCALDETVVDAKGTQHKSWYHMQHLINTSSGHVIIAEGGEPILSPTTRKPIAPPLADLLYDSVFSKEPSKDPIEFNRGQLLQGVTMRLIAQRLLSDTAHGKLYVRGEMSRTHPELPLPSDGKRFHVYVSRHNPGAHEVLGDEGEVQKQLGVMVRVTQKEDEMFECERCVLHLSKSTWEDAHRAEALAKEIMEALRSGLQLLVLHEALGMDDPSGRGAIAFEAVRLRTPGHLLESGVYNRIAIPMKTGDWRDVSLRMLVLDLAAGIHQRPGLERALEALGACTGRMQEKLRAYAGRPSSRARAQIGDDRNGPLLELQGEARVEQSIEGSRRTRPEASSDEVENLHGDCDMSPRRGGRGSVN